VTPQVLSLVVSTIAFFVFGYFIKRWADDNDIPKGITRNISVFVVALALAYGTAWLVDKVVS
jgi:VIT1/CCC1 family predicted Fe2+/Mn2+ transporter